MQSLRTRIPPTARGPHRSGTVGLVLAGIALQLATVASAQHLAADRSAAQRLGVSGATGAIGHPSADMISDLVPSSDIGGIAGGSLVPIPQPELASGVYVNFESPIQRPIDYHAPARLLAVANAPNSSVVFFQQTAGGWSKLREAPVGLEPVAVA